MQKMYFSITLLLLCFSTGLWAQQMQTIRGTVRDQQSELPLIGVAVEVISTDPVVGAVTDAEGYYSVDQVPVGRQTLRISYLGYQTVTIPNVVVTAGKEVQLDLTMEESFYEMDEIVVSGAVDKDRTQNEMATISARSFNLEEVNRFSGGRNDVARLAGNFAGVAVADDSRNDIVIRGNSPTGVLWQLEGIPIPNPNHFATFGTTGGPVSAINPNLLRSSDFLTSAFPAQYGNALSGVFDLGFRSGNRDNYEYTLQVGAFSGLEAMAEGPINREKNSSFLVSYRHSFVELAARAGIPVGTNATPNYRDLSFKVDLGQSKLGNFSFFGIGGTSDIDFLGDEIDEDDLFANPNEDAFARSQLGIVGLRHNIIVGDNAYVRTVLSFSTARNQFDQDNVLETGDKLRVTEADDINNTYSVSSYWNKKYNARFTLRAGFLGQVFDIKTTVEDRNNRPDFDEDGLPDWVTVRDFDGAMILGQVFGQAQYRLSEKWTLNAGLHAQYLDENEDFVLEPRTAVNWQFRPGQRFNLGYGLHHQIQPFPIFFFEEEVAPGEFENVNADLPFTRSHHLVAGYDRKWGPQWRTKVEAYYQFLDQVPVEEMPSSFSVLNAGADFVFPEVGSLVSDGTGRNYGLELTVEKFFSDGYYALLTGSLFDSKYEGSDGIERNTAFNNGYVLNVLAGREWKFGKDKRHAFTLDTRFTTAGGRNYTPVDLEASIAAGEEVLIEEEAFSERFDPYLRWDVKFGIQLNSAKRKLSQQFFLDFQNVTNNDNIFDIRYNEVREAVDEVLQSGFFPDVLYRLQF